MTKSKKFSFIPKDKYKEIKKLTPEDRKEIFEFAMERSIELLDNEKTEISPLELNGGEM